jgi:hypothetical protein
MNITEEMSLAQALDKLDKIMEPYPYALGYFQDGEFYEILNTESWSKENKVMVFDPSRNMINLRRQPNLKS